MPALGVALTFGLASFIHTTVGFGAALVAMALIVPLVGLATAAPVTAMIVLTLQLAIMWRYIDQLAVESVRDMLVALLISTPIGIWGLTWVEEDLLITLLALIILAYVAYNISGKQLTINTRRRWPLLIGFSAGILNGAYNSGGPLIVMYYKALNNSPDVFRINVQTTFVVGTIIVICGHVLGGNMTRDVLYYYVAALPGMVIGFGLGMLVIGFINRAVFHWLVLILLAILGMQMLLN